MRDRVNKKIKTPKRVILAICEGETEDCYVNMLRRHYRLPIIIKSKIAGNKVNLRLVKQYVREIGLPADHEVAVFYFYDMDVENLVQTLKTLPGKAILSNPCIELWFLLHGNHQGRWISSDDIVKKLQNLSPEWLQYKKGTLSLNQQYFLTANINNAVKRAKSLKFPSNPSTKFHEFIEVLEKAKNR